MSWKVKVVVPLVLIMIAILAKFILWDFNVSTGKRVGNLTKISKKGKLIKTWEGTIDEGSGDKLTSYFSVSSDKIGKELYKYEGRQVIIYYTEHILGWPRDTKYDVVSWKPNEEESQGNVVDIDNNIEDSTVNRELSKALLCSFLGSLYKNEKLYKEVKEYIKENNLYLYNQYDKCNE